MRANRFNRFAAGLILSIASSLIAFSASAQPTTDIGKWFCSVLKEPFDPDAALKSFPLEDMPPFVEEREIDDETAVVTFTSEGLDYTIEFDYQFRQDDVDDRYGFTLRIDPEGEKHEIEIDWLMEFGQPERSMFGWAVIPASAKDGSGSATFHFEQGDRGRLEAHWFSAKHIRRATPLCENAKPVPQDAPRPGSLSSGTATDKKSDAVSLWFCKVLIDRLDPESAIAAFPLETLPAPEVEQETTSEGWVALRLTAEGDEYEVGYSHYSDAETGRQFGHALSMRPIGYEQNAFEQVGRWLRGFGAPVKTFLGHSVGKGDPENGFSFAFSIWTMTYTRLAEWDSPEDREQARLYCE